ncbi:MAG: AraC family transcriptional regulator [Desulfobulbaceae bacterium]|nr:MAG: AraC family transcriptional regulator [Desulfobulbaceae bacterium]
MPWKSTDPLGEALHFLHMSGVFYTRSEFTAPWGLALPAFPGCLMFHVVTSGQCWLEVGEDNAPHLLQTGDLVLVPHGEGHQLLSKPGTEAAKLFDLPRKQVSDRYEILQHGQGGDITNLLCGTVRFDHPAAKELIGLLPNLIRVKTWQSTHMEWIQSTLRLMISEAKELQPGGETIITRLADILVIQTIRSWMAEDPQAQKGWLGALQDKQIGYAILLIQREPARTWTVATLAEEVAMSRSAFAARFKELVGESPMQYITRWRMNQAIAWLKHENLSVSELAPRLSYQSEAAFSRAFKRFFGVSPGAVRRDSDLVHL